MTARILPEAEAEIAAAAQWYEDQAGLGEAFLGAVVDALASIEAHPRRFARYDRLRSTRELRRRTLGAFPYSVIYEIGATGLLILAVAHAKRRPNYWRRHLP